jgi:hypothetical protein
VHEFGSDGTAVVAACLVGEVPLNVELRNHLWGKILPKWIKVSLEVPPPPKRFKYAFAVVRVDKERASGILLGGRSHVFLF